MPKIPLDSPRWYYNTDTKKLELVFRVAPPEDSDDPASFYPDKEYHLTIPLPSNPTVVDLPPQAQA